MAKSTSTGVKLGCVEGVPATPDEDGYSALAYVDIGQLTNVPAFGPTITVVESNPLATGVTEKNVGFTNNGSLALEADFDDEDEGQALVLAATEFGTASFGKEHSFELTYPSGRKAYWTGKFFSGTENPGSANSMVTMAVNVEINTAVLRVAAP
ncbi:hypothetical protein [Vibrio casei]|uniref:hypothetical protein n=1 Tax=Vibrio casei TaxID=673372 RepID=UPI003F9CDD4E